MARARREGFGQGSLDSLLDTMTNVVGVLIVVLIVTQVNVSSAAKRIRANLPEVTVRMMAELQERDEQLRADLENLKLPQEGTVGHLEAVKQRLRESLARRDELRESEAEVNAMKGELAVLQRDIEALGKQMEEEGGQLAQIRSTVEKQREQIAGRKPKLVRLPNPRSPDEEAGEVRLIVRGGRLLEFAPEAILDRLAGKIKGREDLLSNDPEQKGRYDYNKIKRFLNSLRESDPDYRFEFAIHPANGHIQVRCFPRDGRGESVDEFLESSSRWRRVMARTFGERDYLRFIVTSDSFEEYILARRMAEDLQIPAGWVFAGDAARQTLSLDARKIRATKDPDYVPPEPQPEPPPTPTPPPPPPTPKPPVDILD